MENRHDAQLRPASQSVMSSLHPAKVLQGLRAWALVLLAAVAIFSAPAAAHKDEDHSKAQATQPAGSPTAPGDPAAPMATMDHGMMGGMQMEDPSQMPFVERFFNWLGRIHPFLVHFPIAFFPAALLTAIVGRRRPSFAAPVQFLVIAGGLLAPFSAATGWLGGMSADPEPILAYHRWLGLAIGLGGLGLGIWAWRRPWEDRGAGMILALTVMTIAIAVQGFLGAGLTHGIEHLMF